MKIHTLDQIVPLLRGASLSASAPLALIFCDDHAIVEKTAKYHLRRGFERVLLFINRPEQYVELDNVINIRYVENIKKGISPWSVVNELRPALLGKWVYIGHNAEFFFYPQSETRSVRDLAEFVMSERRSNVFAQSIDVYAADLDIDHDGLSFNDTHFDKYGYYSRPCSFGIGTIDEEERERIIQIWGGVRWRYGQYFSRPHRRLDRVAFFRVTNDLEFNVHGFTTRPEFFTFHDQHHYSCTSAVVSFRAAKYLLHNPNSRKEIDSFLWFGSEPFHWRSTELLDLGFIETGQWY